MSCTSAGVPCALCGASDAFLVRSASGVERESDLRARFVAARLGRDPVGLEAMDLTQFMHGGPAEIVSCTRCGTIRRNEQEHAHYESDHYDPELMRCLYPRYRHAFAQKRHRYHSLLPPGAEVIEVGSHLGAFLEVAEGWGWRPTGLDIGRETSVFARRQGGTVKQVSLDEYSSRGRPDAIVVWNCFEQIDDPWGMLLRARSMLVRHGLVVLRVPNAQFYRRPPLSAPDWFRALGYNNLLGFPYLNGYTIDALRRLFASTGFDVVAEFPASLLTPPYPEFTKRLRREWAYTRAGTEHLGAANGPWIEIVGRAVDQPAYRNAGSAIIGADGERDRVSGRREKHAPSMRLGQHGAETALRTSLR